MLMDKELIIGVVVVLAAVLTGLVWNTIIAHPLYALSILVFGVSWSLSTLLIRSMPLRYGIGILSAFSIGIVLGAHVWTLVGSFLGSAILVWSTSLAEEQYQSLVKISVRGVTGKSLKIFFTGLSVLFSFAYFGAISGNVSNPASILLPEDVFAFAFRVAETPLQHIVPGVTAQSTVDDALAILLQQQLKSSGQTASLKEIKLAIPAQRQEMIRAINQQLGIAINPNISGNEKISNVVYKLSQTQINQYAKELSGYLPWLLAVGFFFTLKAISVIPYYLTLGATYLVIQLLIYTDFIKKETIEVKKEILV